MSEIRMTPMEYKALTTYDRAEADNFQREMDEGGFTCYGINASRTSTFVSMQYKRVMPRDANGFSDSKVHRDDEVNVLKVCAKFTDTGEWEACLAYENVMHYLLNREWITDLGKITEAGRAALATQEVPA